LQSLNIEKSVKMLGASRTSASAEPLAHGTNEAVLPGQALIRSYLATQKVPPEQIGAREAAVANQIVHLSNDMWAQSWELRRLESSFSPEDIGELSPSASGELQAMKAAHFASLSARFGELKSVLEPMIGPVPPSPGPSVGLSHFAKLGSLLQDIFAVRSGPVPLDEQYRKLAGGDR
jgi:hypothetical protein